MDALDAIADELDADTIVLVGERASLVPGLLTAITELKPEHPVGLDSAPGR